MELTFQSYNSDFVSKGEHLLRAQLESQLGGLAIETRQIQFLGV